MHTLLIEGTFRPGKKDEFLSVWSNQILPTLKSQKGHLDEILLFRDGSEDAVGVSLWQTKADADRYHKEVFPLQVDKVGDLLTGIPKVRSFNVEHSETFNIAASKAA